MYVFQQFQINACKVTSNFPIVIKYRSVCI
nr:MAG TPA_asm: hypothetical protein [Bacteriophage sp.]